MTLVTQSRALFEAHHELRGEDALKLIEALEAATAIGVERAAKWHDDYASVLRKAIAERQAYGIGFGELLWRAEEHESSSKQLRALPPPDAGKERT